MEFTFSIDPLNLARQPRLPVILKKPLFSERGGTLRRGKGTIYYTRSNRPWETDVLWTSFKKTRLYGGKDAAAEISRIPFKRVIFGSGSALFFLQHHFFRDLGARSRIRRIVIRLDLLAEAFIHRSAADSAMTKIFAIVCFLMFPPFSCLLLLLLFLPKKIPLFTKRGNLPSTANAPCPPYTFESPLRNARDMNNT